MLETVRWYDLHGDLRHAYRARLDAEDQVHFGVVELFQARDVHVARDRYTELCRALEPGAEQFGIVLDPSDVITMGWQPHVLEGVQVAVTHTLVQGADIQRPELDVFVTKVVLQKDLRQGCDRHVLVPTYVAKLELLVLRRAAAARRKGAHREREDYHKKFPTRPQQQFSTLTSSPYIE